MDVTAVDVIIVNWNSGTDLTGCLQSVFDQGVAVSVVVVDNGSEDDSVSLARTAHGDRFRLVTTGANLGYTGGNNVGIANLTLERPVLVLNPDERLRPGALASLLAVLQTDPKIAAVGPVRRDPIGQPYGASRIALRQALVWRGAGPLDSRLSQAWIEGAVMLVRADALREVGGFDERFFLYLDEVDWCIRACDAGWRLAVAPEAHADRARSSPVTYKGYYYYWRNLYLLCRLHGPRDPTWRVAWLARLALNTYRHGRASRHVVRLAWWALRDATLGRYGPGPDDTGSGSRPL